jgi:hypothetical protein
MSPSLGPLSDQLAQPRRLLGRQGRELAAQRRCRQAAPHRVVPHDQRGSCSAIGWQIDCSPFLRWGCRSSQRPRVPSASSARSRGASVRVRASSSHELKSSPDAPRNELEDVRLSSRFGLGAAPVEGCGAAGRAATAAAAMSSPLSARPRATLASAGAGAVTAAGGTAGRLSAAGGGAVDFSTAAGRWPAPPSDIPMRCSAAGAAALCAVASPNSAAAVAGSDVGASGIIPVEPRGRAATGSSCTCAGGTSLFQSTPITLAISKVANAPEPPIRPGWPSQAHNRCGHTGATGGGKGAAAATVAARKAAARICALRSAGAPTPASGAWRNGVALLLVCYGIWLVTKEPAERADPNKAAVVG